ncbi:MAG: flagellar type III secretion system pore protein FliP [Clostridiaceae bacterium]|nr:flagellar type III secretion system pore protein FliP [Clostridiaceae bacterium]
MTMNKNKAKRLAFIIPAVLSALKLTAYAVEPGSISIDIGGSGTLEMLFTLTVIALIPSILIMTTSFTRIVIVLSCVRNAVGLQQTPPNQVLVGIALFLSLFIMTPSLERINTEAYQPYQDGTITQAEAIKAGMVPLRDFMLKNTNTKDLNMFLELGGYDQPESLDDIKTTVIIPAFITSELKRAFTIGFLVYLPFLIIDLVVSSTLMSLGMMMLPPSLISLPFKIMLFVLVDGWGLIIKTLITGFN